MKKTENPQESGASSQKAKTFGVRVNYAEAVGNALQKVEELKAKIIQSFPQTTGLGDLVILKLIEEFREFPNAEITLNLISTMTVMETIHNENRPGQSYTAYRKESLFSSGCKVEKVGEDTKYNYPTTNARYEHYRITVKPKFRRSAIYIVDHSSYQSWDEREDNTLAIASLNKKLLKSLYDFCEFIGIRVWGNLKEILA